MLVLGVFMAALRQSIMLEQLASYPIAAAFMAIVMVFITLILPRLLICKIIPWGVFMAA
jgi:hypothetical protein